MDSWCGEDLVKVGPRKMNHYPGMRELCNKASLARHLSRMRKAFPVEYDFFPMTWLLPIDRGRLMEFHATQLRLEAARKAKAAAAATRAGSGKRRKLKKVKRRPSTDEEGEEDEEPDEDEGTVLPRLAPSVVVVDAPSRVGSGKKAQAGKDRRAPGAAPSADKDGPIEGSSKNLVYIVKPDGSCQGRGEQTAPLSFCCCCATAHSTLCVQASSW